MDGLLLIDRLRVQNVNAITGITYGFPGVTNFLGFAHALSRELRKSLQIELNGVGIICHEHQVFSHKLDDGDNHFSLTRNPLVLAGGRGIQAKTASFNEEGRMNMTVSLVIECDGLMAGDVSQQARLESLVTRLIGAMRIAGGQILSVRDVSAVSLPESSSEMRRFTKTVMRRFLPGFVLVDRSEYLAAHIAECENADDGATLKAWWDFSSIVYRAVERGEEAEWQYVPKPNPGYLVPISIGYRAISRLFDPGEVRNVRDTGVPVVFAEAVYSVGEWLSPHRINSVNDLLWRYTQTGYSYLCRGNEIPQPEINEDDDESFVPY